jgi:hypothetical protein
MLCDVVQQLEAIRLPIIIRSCLSHPFFFPFPVSQISRKTFQKKLWMKKKNHVMRHKRLPNWITQFILSMTPFNIVSSYMHSPIFLSTRPHSRAPRAVHSALSNLPSLVWPFSSLILMGFFFCSANSFVIYTLFLSIFMFFRFRCVRGPHHHRQFLIVWTRKFIEKKRQKKKKNFHWLAG